MQAADVPVDLVLGGQGALPWSISSIGPGDRGSERLTVTNEGSSTAYLRIWISDVSSTDADGDGAALIKYLLFSVIAEGLTTTLDLPATIDRFPASPSDRGQLVIGPIAAGASATVRWTWEFVDTGSAQNDAQGDGLSFSISYMLTDAPPPAVAYKYMAVEMLGWQTPVEMDSTGVVQHDVDAVDPMGVHHLKIAAGTRIVDEEGNFPSRIVLSTADIAAPPPAPAGTFPVLPTYRLQGLHADGAEVNLSFSQPATIILGVNASRVPAGYLPMGVHVLSGDGWSRLPAVTGNLSKWSAEGAIDRTGTLAVFAAPADADASQLHVIDLTISPAVQADGWPLAISTTTGRSITVTASIANPGNSSGIYHVDLLIDGKVKGTATAVLEPGETSTVVLAASGIEDGAHTVTVLDRTARFASGTSVEWLPIVLSNVALLSALVFVRKRPFHHRPPSPPKAAPEMKWREEPPKVKAEEAANPQLLASIEEAWEARKTAEGVVEPAEEVWEARRTAEGMVEGHRPRPPEPQ